MRTIPNLSDHLQPLEDVISNDFVPSLFGSKVKDLVRRLIALPPKLGGMGITNPIEIANDEYENSIRLTQNFTKMIINQGRFGSIDENKMKVLPCLITTVVSTGFMIQPHPRLVAWNRQTQCLAVNQVKIPVIQCPGIFLTPFPVLLVVTIPVLLVVTHPVLLVVTFLVLLVIMSPVLLVRRILVLPALVTLCIPIPNVVPSVKTMKTRCPPPPRAAR